METTEFVEFAARLPTLTGEQRAAVAALLGPPAAAGPAGAGRAGKAGRAEKPARDRPTPANRARVTTCLWLSDLATYSALVQYGRADLIPPEALPYRADLQMLPSISKLVSHGLAAQVTLPDGEPTYVPAARPPVLRYEDLSVPAGLYVRATRVGPYLSRAEVRVFTTAVGRKLKLEVLGGDADSGFSKAFTLKRFGLRVDPTRYPHLPPVERLPDEPVPSAPPEPVAPAGPSADPQPQEAP